MKRIQLTKGLVALVDDADYQALNQHKWYAQFSRKNGTYYAARKDKGTFTLMHREIMGMTKGDGIQVDHKNSDTLDNRRKNLRPATNSQNSMNRERPSNNTSGVKGVSYCKRNNRWAAYIDQDRKRRHLGYFDTLAEATAARRTVERLFFGEFAR